MVLFLSNNARAWFHVEPIWAVSKGTYKEGTNTGTYENQSQGLRLAYTGSYFFMGADSSFGKAKFDESFLSEGTRHLYSNINLGVIAGLKFRWLRIYYAYNASYLRKKEQNATKRTYYGDVYKLGIGINLIWRLHLNYENIRSIYDEYEEDRAPTLKISPFDLKSDLISLSLVLKF